MKRRSPYRHPVRGHKRSGVDVKNYERGKGSKPKQKIKTRIPLKGGDFTVLIYFDRERESHPVRAKTYTEALNAGLRMIQTPEIPDQIRIRRV